MQKKTHLIEMHKCMMMQTDVQIYSDVREKKYAKCKAGKDLQLHSCEDVQTIG